MSKQKTLGTALENRIVKRAQAKGLEASRQPGSGMYREYPNDVVVSDVLVECKVRSRHPSWTEMREWLENVRANAPRVGLTDGVLIYNLKGDHHPKVIMDLDFFLQLLTN